MAPTSSPMYHLFDKIKKLLKMALLAWSRNLGNTKDKLEKKHKELEALSSMNLLKNQEVI